MQERGGNIFFMKTELKITISTENSSGIRAIDAFRHVGVLQSVMHIVRSIRTHKYAAIIFANRNTTNQRHSTQFYSLHL